MIINSCLAANVTRVYIAIDGPTNFSAKHDVDKCIAYANEFKKKYPNLVFTKISEFNLGSAASVLSACDWVFTQEEFAVVIEDDCLPTDGFFTWIRDYKKYLEIDKSILIMSGNQFAPYDVTRGLPTLSKYPLIWGWATSKSNWRIMISLIYDFKIIKKRVRRSSYIDYCFWRSGARRSLEGYIDAWDIPLAFLMNQIGAKALLPAYNLVRNVGGDIHATHTRDFSKWLYFPTQNYSYSNCHPVQNLELDYWYRKNLFEIRFRHIFSTKISWLLDLLGVRNHARSPLLNRITLKSQ